MRHYYYLNSCYHGDDALRRLLPIDRYLTRRASCTPFSPFPVNISLLGNHSDLAYKESIVRNRWFRLAHRKDHKNGNILWVYGQSIDGFAAPVSGHLDCFTDFKKTFWGWPSSAAIRGSSSQTCPKISWHSVAKFRSKTSSFQANSSDSKKNRRKKNRRKLFVNLLKLEVNHNHPLNYHQLTVKNICVLLFLF